MRPIRHRARRGSVLVEFALIAIVSIMLLGAILTFGTMIFQGQVAQQVADVASQEIARLPEPLDAVLGMSLQTLNTTSESSPISTSDQTFLSQIYNEQLLCFDPSGLPSDTTFAQYASANWPIVNRLLAPVMIYDSDLKIYRFPGAVVFNSEGQQTVLVPLLTAGSTSVTWAKPVEEIPSVDSSGLPISQYDAVSGPGLVAIRVNIPSQSSSMTGMNSDNTPIAADDSALAGDLPPGYSFGVQSDATLLPDDQISDGSNLYSGRYGLGAETAFAQAVRPFRKVLTGQAIYRRELYLSASSALPTP